MGDILQKNERTIKYTLKEERRMIEMKKIWSTEIFKENYKRRMGCLRH